MATVAMATSAGHMAYLEYYFLGVFHDHHGNSQQSASAGT